MESVIKVEKLTKNYKTLKAVDALSFNVKKGEILGLLGPNGSGKTTTINCLLSLLNFDEGYIEIFGKEMKPDSYDIKRKIGVVFQDVAVFDELTVYENIDYFCGLYIKNKNDRKKYVDEAIDLVSLNEFRKFKPKQLSGGLLRRLNIACGIAHKPSLIFLDEPTVAVDPQSRNNILEGIKKLNKDGATIVYTTHYMEEVEQLCDRIIIMDKGKVIKEGTKESLKKDVEIKEIVSLEALNISKEFLDSIELLKEVKCTSYNGKTLCITYLSGDNNIINLIKLMEKYKIDYNSLSSFLPTLNDVFLELTGKELRD